MAKKKSDLKPIWVSPTTHRRLLAVKAGWNRARREQDLRGQVHLDEIMVQLIVRSKIEKALKIET
jgi:elongation factor P hydroxylase